MMAECLRHLMRACEGVDPQKEAIGHPAFPDCDFPQAPDENTGMFDINQTVNFCFGIIFWKEINDNSLTDGDIHRRKLGRRHGLYSMAAELLELMSKENTLGEPHPALHPEHVFRYYREVALAQLDIGDLANAQRNLERLLELRRSEPNALFKMNAQLDLVVVLAARDSLEIAYKLIVDVEQEFTKLPQPSEESRNMRLELIGKRIKARKAQLLYLDGKYEAAAEIFASLDRRDLIRREIAHPYIALLGAMGGTDNFEKARACAADAAHASYKEAYHHEELGYRIAIAHARRKLGGFVEAEQDLDRVYDLILSEGCSERTYLSFLLEAGRVLMAQGRFARAYTVYLRPCLDRALSRGYVRAARTASRHALRSLNEIPREVASCTHPGNFGARLEKLVRSGEETISKGLSRYEPKYSFGKFEPGQWFPILSEEAAISDQIEQIKASMGLLAVDDGTHK